MASPRQNSGLVAHTESIRILAHVCMLSCVNAFECLYVRKVYYRIHTHLRHGGVCTVCVCGPASSTLSRALTVPKEALMTPGVEGGWVVAVEVCLATGHHGSSQAQPRCTHCGNSLGSVWALGLGWVWSTPLIRLQIVS